MTKEQRKRTLELANLLEKNPEWFDMHTWGKTKDGESLYILGDVVKNLDTCGTTGCLAGLACWYFKKIPTSYSGPFVCYRALELLGIPYNTFFHLYWPEPFRTEFERAKTQKQKAKIAARLLRFLARETDE